MAGVGGRLGTATARVVRRTMTRLKDGGAPWDYEEAYPVLYLGGGGACWRKGLVRDSPRQRLDGCGLAVAPCSADAGRDDGAGVPGESEGFGLRLWVWRLRVREVQGTGSGSQERSVSPCHFGRRLWQGAAATGWARRLRWSALQAGDTEAGAFALQTQRGGVGWARQGIGQRRGRGVVSFAQSCSEICGQRRNGRLGGDDFRLASYVFDEMSARKEMGKRREGWGAGPLAGGV
uniref:Uncharacterized protein n=1 Tax=Oryza sativa subsp. japonica TaxID=39947 RepID=Q2QZE4_ORYSJ|nr:hypothetical protein LOC_Os11g46280 [Oryza sativa Japonica Group]